MNIGFDNQKYLQMQSAHIRERISMFGDKLYLEFGGKLFDDYHAARVLPGFEPDSKLKMLLQLKDQAEIVIAISASALETNKTRRDLGLTYDPEVLRLTEAFRNIGLYVGSVVITQYAGQPAADPANPPDTSQAEYNSGTKAGGLQPIRRSYAPQSPCCSSRIPALQTHQKMPDTFLQVLQHPFSADRCPCRS